MPTARQVQVLELIADDQRRPDIAAKLGIKRGTVSAYAQQGAYCLGVNTVAGAIAVACAYNIVPMPGGRIAVPHDVIDNALTVLAGLASTDLPVKSALAIQAVVNGLRRYIPPGGLQQWQAPVDVADPHGEDHTSQR